jgi:protein-S-isoprenylcysteine O-methyltransferase Ste14
MVATSSAATLTGAYARYCQKVGRIVPRFFAREAGA